MGCPPAFLWSANTPSQQTKLACYERVYKTLALMNTIMQLRVALKAVISSPQELLSVFQGLMETVTVYNAMSPYCVCYSWRDFSFKLERCLKEDYWR